MHSDSSVCLGFAIDAVLISFVRLKLPLKGFSFCSCLPFNVSSHWKRRCIYSRCVCVHCVGMSLHVYLYSVNVYVYNVFADASILQPLSEGVCFT